MLRIGVAGWSYADWDGVVYPRERSRGFHGLAYLARYLDVMEINSSFYAIPQARNTARWVTLVEDRPGFRFIVKLHRAFTHEVAGTSLNGPAREFNEGIAPIVESGRCLGLLVQFPVSQHADEGGWKRVETIRELFPSATLCLELRHRSWFEPKALVGLAGLGVGLVHVDMPAARDHPPEEHPTLGSLGYLRLHGRNRRAWFDREAGRDDRYDYRYGRTEVCLIAERMKRIQAKTPEAVLIANNHFGGKAVANALELKGLLTDTRPPAPEPLIEAFPELRDHTLAEGQQLLF